MPPKPAMPGSAPGKGGKALLGLGCLAVGLIVGYGAGRVSTGTPINPLSDQKGGYEGGYQAAMQKIADSGLLPQAPKASSSLDGTVKSSAEGRLTIEADIQAFDPLGLAGLPTERTVTITDSTALVQLEEMTPEEFEDVQRAFNEALADYRPDPEAPVAPPALPSRYKETKISLSEIKVGDRVTVEAAADILNAASFEAVSVAVQPAAAVAPTPEVNPTVPSAPATTSEPSAPSDIPPAPDGTPGPTGKPPTDAP